MERRNVVSWPRISLAPPLLPLCNILWHTSSGWDWLQQPRLMKLVPLPQSAAQKALVCLLQREMRLHYVPDTTPLVSNWFNYVALSLLSQDTGRSCYIEGHISRFRSPRCNPNCCQALCSMPKRQHLQHWARQYIVEWFVCLASLPP